MRLKSNATNQKIRGGYYTPIELSNFIVKNVYDNQNMILEPSCGDGRFVSSIINETNGKFKRMDAVEYVKEEAAKTKKVSQNVSNINVINDDFYNFYVNSKDKYDLIIGNPPYIRYQYLKPEQREKQSEVLLKNKMTSNKLINSWVFFLVACVDLLNSGGKVAFVLPAELLQVVYAKELRRFLIDNLQKISIISFDNLIFDEAEQEVIVFIGEKKTKQTQKCIIANYSYNDINDLVTNFKYDSSKYNYVNNFCEKWTKYYLSREENKLISEIENDSKFRKFEDVALINVGITTGNNDFFSLDKQTVEKYDLNKFALPLIGRSSHAHSIFFDKKDWQKNVNKGVKSYLICINEKINYEKLNEKQKEYIDLGIKTEVDKGYKCSIRNQWYSIPSVWVPNAFFLRRSNVYPKFVLNKINAVSTDTMHRINFYEGYNKNKILLSHYNSITFAFVEINGRSYGGGVLELLPSEVSKIMLPNIDNISDEKTDRLLKIVNDYVENNKNIEELLDIIDKKILIDELKIDKNIIDNFRKIWKMYLIRRKNRGKNTQE